MDSTRRCSVDGCERDDIQARDLCRMHYFRWYRTGSTEVRRPQRANREVCVVDGCDLMDEGPHGLCAKHRTRMKRHGDVDTVRKPGPLGARSPFWGADDIGYQAAHRRVRARRGRASDRTCVDCGTRAAQWSYDHADPQEKSSENGPFSTDADHYEPRCVPCHKVFDLGDDWVSPSRRVSPAHVDEIARLKATGLSNRKIARIVGLSETSVWRVVRRSGA